jgi:hypothetical protein
LIPDFLYQKMEDARMEAYEYFNKNIRPLPKLRNGRINKLASLSGHGAYPDGGDTLGFMEVLPTLASSD